MADLVELDSLEVLVIIDNELDPISPCPNEAVQQSGGLKDLSMNGTPLSNGRGEAKREMRMDSICCSAHGLSLLITATKGDQKHTLLFDTGPTEAAFEGNARRLKADLGRVETVHLSHWHRDHSGGMLKALSMIQDAKKDHNDSNATINVDLHPARPAYRGIQADTEAISWEADPSFDEITQAGGTVMKNDETHTVSENFFLISGEIPRVTSYELGLKRGIRFDADTGKWIPDHLIQDERFVMCKLKDKGLVLFTGCSHAGVVNASRHALSLGNGAPLYAVMGGYHLADGEEALIKQSVVDLQALDVKVLLAGHCTGWRAKFRIQEVMPGRLVPSSVGSRFVL